MTTTAIYLVDSAAGAIDDAVATLIATLVSPLEHQRTFAALVLVVMAATLCFGVLTGASSKAPWPRPRPRSRAARYHDTRDDVSQQGDNHVGQDEIDPFDFEADFEGSECLTTTSDDLYANDDKNAYDRPRLLPSSPHRFHREGVRHTQGRSVPSAGLERRMRELVCERLEVHMRRMGLGRESKPPRGAYGRTDVARSGRCTPPPSGEADSEMDPFLSYPLACDQCDHYVNHHVDGQRRTDLRHDSATGFARGPPTRPARARNEPTAACPMSRSSSWHGAHLEALSRDAGLLQRHGPHAGQCGFALSGRPGLWPCGSRGRQWQAAPSAASKVWQPRELVSSAPSTDEPPISFDAVRRRALEALSGHLKTGADASERPTGTARVQEGRQSLRTAMCDLEPSPHSLAAETAPPMPSAVAIAAAFESRSRASATPQHRLTSPHRPAGVAAAARRDEVGTRAAEQGVGLAHGNSTRSAAVAEVGEIEESVDLSFTERRKMVENTIKAQNEQRWQHQQCKQGRQLPTVTSPLASAAASTSSIEGTASLAGHIREDFSLPPQPLPRPPLPPPPTGQPPPPPPPEAAASGFAEAAWEHAADI